MRRETEAAFKSKVWFQFTHPVWGATTLSKVGLLVSGFQFTHPVWGATKQPIRHIIVPLVSIHAPRVGCDGTNLRRYIRGRAFQFTHPVWGATMLEEIDSLRAIVSIHAPRVRCDVPLCGASFNESGFNSRTPCGVRPDSALCLVAVLSFNSRTPCGVRPTGLAMVSRPTRFNSRTPCGVRRTCLWLSSVSMRFNSRTPCGVRLYHLACAEFWRKFQFTHPVWGATDTHSNMINSNFSFNSRTPCGVRLCVSALMWS